MPIDNTDNRERVDVIQLLELYKTTWWALNRSAADVRQALDHSHPVVSAWDGAQLVGFTRVISDWTYRPRGAGSPTGTKEEDSGWKV